MKNFLKKALGFCFAFSIAITGISLSVPDACPVVSAHSGRTDASGGHHDYKNKSGLGSYHYHHGYPAHLHENGICPYDNPQPAVPKTATAPPVPAVPDTTNLPGENANTGTLSPENNIAATITPVNYSLIFDAAFYAAANPDVAALYGTDASLLFQHFLTAGMKEGRQGNAAFNVWTYKAEHPELAAVFGDDLTQYYIYYCSNPV